METMTITFEGVCFSVKAVAAYAEEQWVDWGMSRYFENRAEDMRMTMLQQVHSLCMQLGGVTTEPNMKDEPAPIPSPKVKRTRKNK